MVSKPQLSISISPQGVERVHRQEDVQDKG